VRSCVPSALGTRYYGANVYDITGSSSHEAFIYNAARGRLDMYTFDLWNMNQCQCAYPQKGLDMCVDGEWVLQLPLHLLLPVAKVPPHF
jgi:hypothetical protein